MSVKSQKTVKAMKEAIQYADIKKPKPYDAIATVVRIDGNTAWVHFDGGAEETPVRKTINAKTGDVVQVRVGGGDAWIVGNDTAPPTDDTTANVANTNAKKANKTAVTAVNLAELANAVATRAQTSADGKNTIYYGNTTPTDGNEGDTWFNGGEDNAIYIYQNGSWVKQELGEDAIANLSITNAKIADGTIQDAKIGNLDGGKITAGSISANKIDINGLITVGELATDAEVLVVHNEATDARKYADNYLTAISGTTGISVHSLNDTSNYVNVTSNAVNVVTGDTNVAQFGSTVRVGTETGSRLVLSPTAIEAYNTNNDNVLSIGLTASTTYVRYALIKYSLSAGATKVVTLPSYIASGTMVSITISEDTVSVAGSFSYGTAKSGSVGELSYIYNGSTTLTLVSQSSSVIRYIYVSWGVTGQAPAWTFGSRASSSTLGQFSMAIGIGNIASGARSTAIGHLSTASGIYAIALGEDTTASGSNSFANGYGTISQRKSQTVIGEYNTADSSGSATTRGSYAFIIGNGGLGSGSQSQQIVRSNALTVDWDGNLLASGTVRGSKGWSGNLVVDGGVTVKQGSGINSYGVDDTAKTLAYIYDSSGSNAYIFGASSYSGSEGSVFYRGNSVSIQSKGAVSITSTEVTNSGKYSALYKVTTMAVSVSAGSSGTSVATAQYAIPSASQVRGYDCVGIVGITSASINIDVFNYHKDSNTQISAGFVRRGTTSQAYNVTFYLLWLKATSAS